MAEQEICGECRYELGSRSGQCLRCTNAVVGQLRLRIAELETELELWRQAYERWPAEGEVTVPDA